MARYAFNELLELHRRLGDPARLPDPDRDQHAVDRPLPDRRSGRASATTASTSRSRCCVLFLVARYNYLGKAPRGRRTIALSIVDLALVLMIVGLGLATAFDPAAITDNVKLGEVPNWSDLLFGMTVAVIAYTGIEAAANLAPEVRVGRAGAAAHGRRGRRRRAARVRRHVGGRADGAAGGARACRCRSDSQTAGYGTALGGQYIEAPVLGRRRGPHRRIRGRAARVRGCARRDARV